MSWLSSICKKVSKIQPGKVVVNAAKSIASNLPVIGGLIGGIGGGAQAAAQASQPTQMEYQPSTNTYVPVAKSNTMKYVLIAGGALVVIVIMVLVMRKR